MPKRTYNPSNRKKSRKFGFLVSKKRNKRRSVLASRRQKGRKRLTPVS